MSCFSDKTSVELTHMTQCRLGLYEATAQETGHELFCYSRDDLIVPAHRRLAPEMISSPAVRL